MGRATREVRRGTQKVSFFPYCVQKKGSFLAVVPHLGSVPDMQMHNRKARLSPTYIVGESLAFRLYIWMSETLPRCGTITLMVSIGVL